MSSVTTLLSNKGYSIRVSDLDSLSLARLKRQLTVQPKTHPNYPAAQPFPAFEEGDKWFRIPRFFGIEQIGNPRVNALAQGKEIENPVRLDFNGVLWPSQETPHNKLLEHLKREENGGSGLLCLHTAGGKTVITLSLVSHLRQRTCVLVHKSILLQQWKERIQQFLPEAKIGIVQGKEKTFSEDCDIYIVMIQTLQNIPTVPFIFGFTIVDECHHLPSETFSRVLFKVNARYMLGLSATPQRMDGLTRLLHWHLGEIVYQEKPDRGGQKTTRVEVHRFDSSPLKLDVKRYSQCITKLTEHTVRNRYIIEATRQIFVADRDRKRRLLILTDRVNHAVHLRDELETAMDTTWDISAKRTCGLLVAGMSQDFFKLETGKDIVLGTYGLMLEGVDIPELNGILLATPRRSVAQAIGRILRKVHRDIHPLIVDISDSDFRGQERARLTTYRTELNGNIEVVYRG